MDDIIIENNRFINFPYKEVEFVFSTAENELNFNKALPEGISNLEKLKEWFELKEVGYCNQIHSDKVNIYSCSNIDGDALITNKRRVALGVFTADCIPILLYDKGKGVIAAIHSGWRGTVKEISAKTVEKMISDFGANPKDIVAYIGPHNRRCCYEIGQDVKDEFNKNETFKNIDYIYENKIDLAACVTKQLLDKGINIENIHDTQICTYCSKEYKLHSYRKSKGSYGRMFSFIYIK